MPAAIPKKFICSISNEIMRDPVNTAVGQTYERKNITEWLKTHNTDPNTNQILLHKYLTDDFKTKNKIKQWLKENPQGDNDKFLSAVKNNNVDEINNQLFLGVNINYQDSNGYSALHHAVEKKNLSVIKILIKEGAKLDLKSTLIDQYKFSEKTPLHLAAELGGIEIIEELIAAKASIEALNSDKETPLKSAARCGMTEACKTLIQAGAHKNGSSECDSTPLTNAVFNDHLETIKCLISLGSEVNYFNGNQSALMVACNKNRTAMLQLLLELGANINLSTKSDNITTLHVAARNRSLDCVKILIKKNADLDVKDKNGDTPLIYAILNAQTDIAELLIDSDANIHEPNNAGNTPLHIAAMKGNEALVKLLILNGANPKIRNSSNLTPAELARDNKYEELAAKIENYRKEFKNIIRTLPLEIMRLREDVLDLQIKLNMARKPEERKSSIFMSNFKMFKTSNIKSKVKQDDNNDKCQKNCI